MSYNIPITLYFKTISFVLIFYSCSSTPEEVEDDSNQFTEDFLISKNLNTAGSTQHIKKKLEDKNKNESLPKIDSPTIEIDKRTNPGSDDFFKKVQKSLSDYIQSNKNSEKILPKTTKSNNDSSILQSKNTQDNTSKRTSVTRRDIYKNLNKDTIKDIAKKTTKDTINKTTKDTTNNTNSSITADEIINEKKELVDGKINIENNTREGVLENKKYDFNDEIDSIPLEKVKKLSLFDKSNIDFNENIEEKDHFTYEDFLYLFSKKNKITIGGKNPLLLKFYNIWSKIFDENEIKNIDIPFLSLVYKNIKKLSCMTNSSQIEKINIEYISNLITFTFEFLHNKDDNVRYQINQKMLLLDQVFISKNVKENYEYMIKLVEHPGRFVDNFLRLYKRYKNIIETENDINSKINIFLNLFNTMNHSILSLCFAKVLAKSHPFCFKEDTHNIISDRISFLNNLINKELKKIKKMGEMEEIHPILKLTLRLNKFCNRSFDLKYLSFKSKLSSIFRKKRKK